MMNTRSYGRADFGYNSHWHRCSLNSGSGRKAAAGAQLAKKTAAKVVDHEVAGHLVGHSVVEAAGHSIKKKDE